MISSEMTKALNGQINFELYSTYLYLSFSSYCSFVGLKGAANWFSIQVQEEMTHVQRMYKYVVSTGAHVVLTAIEEPPVEFKSLTHMFEETLKHERLVTGRINDLVNRTIEEKDHATEVLLQWFVSEQVEEEEAAKDVLDKLKLAGEDGSGLLLIDTELGARVFVPPPDLAQA